MGLALSASGDIASVCREKAQNTLFNTARTGRFPLELFLLFINIHYQYRIGAISGAGSRSNLTGLFNEEPEQRPVAQVATCRDSPGGGGGASRMSPIVEKFK